MLKTYTLYLIDGGTRFEPALCLSDVDAMARARELLLSHPECEAIDVFFGSDHLFRVVGSSSRDVAALHGPRETEHPQAG